MKGDEPATYPVDAIHYEFPVRDFTEQEVYDDPVVYEDSNVYYEDEIVTGQELDYVDEPFDEMNTDVRLLMYPQQRKLKAFRQMRALNNKTGRLPIYRMTEQQMLKVPNMNFDISKTLVDQINYPNYEVQRNYFRDVEPEEPPAVQMPVEETSTHLTPLPDKYFVRRGTGDAASVGLHALAVLCDKCLICFRTKTAYSKHHELHKVTDDPEKLLPRTQIACPMMECDVRADCLATLIEHVKICHERPDMCFESIEFTDLDQFKRWKGEMERLTMSRYTRSSGKHNVFSKSTYFHCHYSGSTPGTKPNQQRNRASKKMGKSCTAFFHIKEKEDGKVLLRGCVKHVGHEPNVRTMPLSDIIKKEIATYLLEGLNEHEIVDLLREGSQQDDRRHYIQAYEVRNVHNKLVKHQYNMAAEEPDQDYLSQEEMVEYEARRRAAANRASPTATPKQPSPIPPQKQPLKDAKEETVMEITEEAYAIAPPYAAVEEVASADYVDEDEDAIPLEPDTELTKEIRKRTFAEMRESSPISSAQAAQATVDVTTSKALDPNAFTKRKYDPITGLPVKRGPKTKAHRKLLEEYHKEQAKHQEALKDLKTRSSKKK
ncbi:unnamed protein product [Caenorhabditis angaria]|uniref:C2H2-type domain-containing protein n=1 Tax=Caenorhabditis angaria TaxID=860376 RepID=A0A9P1NAQ6_9PELO|nr:unnamed protein product [Caenorhabditis angaria]